MNSKEQGKETEKFPAMLPNDPSFFHVMGANKEEYSYMDIYVINKKHFCIGTYFKK